MHHGATGTAHLIAYITLEHATTADRDTEIVDQWQHMNDELYGAEVEVSGFGMDFRGWNSSYTDDPIPLEEMVEWRSATVDRIMALQPRRVLEIGAGSGLVLSQIAPRCEHYVGTDMSAVAIDNLARSLEQRSCRGGIGSSCWPSPPTSPRRCRGATSTPSFSTRLSSTSPTRVSGRRHRQCGGSAGPWRALFSVTPQPQPAGRVANRAE